jgi:hypothetical protein
MPSLLCGIVFALVGIGVLAMRRGPSAAGWPPCATARPPAPPSGSTCAAPSWCLRVSSAIAGLAGALFGGLGFTAASSTSSR